MTLICGVPEPSRETQPNRPRHSTHPDLRGPIPHAWNRHSAVGTLPVDEVVGHHAEAPPADDDRIAAVAMRALPVTERPGDVAGIDEAQAGSPADLIRTEQRGSRRVAVVRPLVG